MRNIWIGLMASLLLSGCVGDDYNGGPSYGQQPPVYYGGAPGYGGGMGRDDDDRLNGRQREALEDGCDAKYGDNKSKRRACKSQATDGWRDALIKGCYQNYRKNEKALRRCLAGV